MMQSEVSKPRGILNRKAGEKKFHHSRHLAAKNTAFFIEHYWIVEWDLRGQQPYLVETLPHPSVAMVLEKNELRVVGVMTGKFRRILENKGRVFGIKFRPGAFYPFMKSPVSGITNRTVRITDIFGIDGQKLQASILVLDDTSRMVELAENFIHQRLPHQDAMIGTINQILQYIRLNRAITKVEDIVTRFMLNKRTLQRIFNQYVGVSPKWVIKRYRLHEAVEQLAAGELEKWPKLALDLGYFDQAHFIKDFKSIIGKSPTEYMRKFS